MSIVTTYIVDENDDEDDSNVEPSNLFTIILPISTNDSFSPCTISLYVLRQADSSDNWKIQALFENDLKYTFKILADLNNQKVNLLNLVDV